MEQGGGCLGAGFGGGEAGAGWGGAGQFEGGGAGSHQGVAEDLRGEVGAYGRPASESAGLLSYADLVISEPARPEGTAVELMRAMTRLRARLRTESAIDDHPWTWSHLTTLHRIIEDGPLSVSELAQAEHVRRQSMAETVAAMRDGGLVATEKDPDDGRRTLLSATDAARALVARISPAREAWLAGVISTTLGPDERRTLDRAAAIMNQLADSGT